MKYRAAIAAFLGTAAFWAPLATADNAYVGLLRARDLTPFGFLRLDMRPAHAIVAPEGTWSFEVELAHQNTWALSPEVEEYLESLPGRRQIGDAEVAAIRALPGENYLVDLELANVDVTIGHKFSKHWGGYLVLSGVTYSGGFLDDAIEQFHHSTGFDPNGRPAVRQNDIKIISDIKSAQFALFDAPISGGLLDPIVGVRYSGAEQIKGWNFVLEAAAKLPFRGRKTFLSTGKSDFGLQATLQRFSDHHAWYVSGSGVYYDGTTSITPTEPQIVPTLIVGYERRLSPTTHVILQGYLSDSVYTRNETDLGELLAVKYQLSLGVYRRLGRGLLSFAFTENLQNLNNTPDIGLQIGWAYNPALELSGD